MRLAGIAWILVTAGAAAGCVSSVDLSVFDAARDGDGGAEAEADVGADADADADGDVGPEDAADVPEAVPPTLSEVLELGRGVEPRLIPFDDGVLAAWIGDPTGAGDEPRRLYFRRFGWDAAASSVEAELTHPVFWPTVADGRPERSYAWGSCGPEAERVGVFLHATAGAADRQTRMIEVYRSAPGEPLSVSDATGLLGAEADGLSTYAMVASGDACVLAWLAEPTGGGPKTLWVRSVREWRAPVAALVEDANCSFGARSDGGETVPPVPMIVDDGLGGVIVAVSGSYGGTPATHTIVAGMRLSADGTAMWTERSRCGGQELLAWPVTDVPYLWSSLSRGTIVRNGTSVQIAVVAGSSAGTRRCLRTTSIAVANGSGIRAPNAIDDCAEPYTIGTRMAVAFGTVHLAADNVDLGDLDPAEFRVRRLAGGAPTPLFQGGGLPHLVADATGRLLTSWLISAGSAMDRWSIRLLRLESTLEPSAGWPYDWSHESQFDNGVEVRTEDVSTFDDPVVAGEPLPAPDGGAVFAWSEADTALHPRIVVRRVFDNEP